MYLGSCQTFIIELLSGLFIQCLRKIFPKPFVIPLMRTVTCTYQGVRNVSFLEIFAYILHKWPPKDDRQDPKKASVIFRLYELLLSQVAVARW